MEKLLKCWRVVLGYFVRLPELMLISQGSILKLDPNPRAENSQKPQLRSSQHQHPNNNKKYTHIS